MPPLENDQGVVLCHSLTTIVDEHGAPFETVDDGTAVVDFAGRRWPIDPLDRRLDSDRPSVRYHDIIHHTVLVGEIWGVMRHSALLRTALFGRYFGSDRPMMAELALMGRFVTIPEPLVTISLAASSSSLLSSGLNVMRIPLNTVE